MNDEKLTPIEHALAAALKLPQPQAESILMQICKNGLKPIEQETKPNGEGTNIFNR